LGKSLSISKKGIKKTRFTEEQMVNILREADHAPVAMVAERHGVCEVKYTPRASDTGSLRRRT
jgi:hypothetical protein